ncbi:MAG: phosphatase PAP2 family protein [Treponema sp.]|nr:phosphatase PAP2 family protein [Treponema sp.]
MKKYAVFLIFLCLIQLCLYGEPTDTENVSSPHIFHNIGWNLLHSFTYNYGFNFIGAGVGTWGMIETGIDWKWRNTVFESTWLSNIGGPVMATGGVVPVITPLLFFLSGKIFSDERSIVAASALTQTLILTMVVQSPLKMITGRRDPGLVDNFFYERICGEDDFSGVFNWFNMDFINGWPSGHTANAFSAAATLSEIYHDNIWVKVGAYTYAAFIGFGVTVHAHWASEAVAGALIGYAIGKTVGKSYRKFLDKNEDPINISFYCTPYSAGIYIRL